MTSAVAGRAADAAPVTTEEADPILRAPTPSWVEPLACEPSGAGKPAGAPAEILVNEQQDRLTLDGGDYYYRLVVRLLNAEGVRQNAEWSVRYAQEYESVSWHVLTITRGTEEQDRLATARFKKRQREPGFETQILDGQTTALTVLSDVQVGDVLEVSYTRHVANPLLRGHMSATHFLGAGYPIRHQRVLVRTPLSEPDVFTSFTLPPGTHKLPAVLFDPAKLRLGLDVTENATERVHLWEARNLPAIVFDQNIPAQAAPYYPMMRCTSFRAWMKVAEWGDTLFSASAGLPEALKEQVERWKRDSKTPEDRLRTAVRWVQDDIRYFAMAMGDHNLKPRPLAEVCATRFGDCKDKALLLSVLLRELGFEAWPALVNSHLRDQLATLGPSPFAFDHAIVAYRYGGKVRWIDATLKNQQGPTGEWAVPPYGKALILSKDISDLVDVPLDASDEPDTETRDLLKVDAVTGAVEMRTQVTLRGLQADFYRQQLEALTPAEMSTRWFNFISRFYRKLEEVEAPVVSDEPATNRITINAHYRIPEFCRTEDGVRQLAVYAYALRSLLEAPDSRRRSWPYALNGHRFVRHRIELEAPQPLGPEQHPELILTEGIDYRAEKGLMGSRLIAVHELRVTGDFVPASKMGEFCDAVDDLLNSLATTLRLVVPTPAKTAPATSPTEKPAAAALP